jgi:hypothetical protein
MTFETAIPGSHYKHAFRLSGFLAVDLPARTYDYAVLTDLIQDRRQRTVTGESV